MAKVIVGDIVTGRVVNIYSPPQRPIEGVPPTYQWTEWVVPDNFPVAVGDPFDPKDPMCDAADLTQFKALQRHENLIRQLIRALRGTSTQANNSANAEGLPQSADVPDVTIAQTRAFFKSQMT